MLTQAVEDSSELAQYLNETQPFGPIDASVIEVEHNEIMHLFFDRQNRIYGALRRRPSIIMGRRGSGKTSYLHSVYLDHDYTHVIELHCARAFSNVIKQIEGRLPGGTFAESVAELWDILFWCALFARLVEECGSDSALAPVRDYLAKIGVRGQRNADEVLWTVVDTISEKAGNRTVGLIAEILRKTAGISFDQAKEAATAFMKKAKLRAILLLDSLDSFALNMDCVAHTLKGLLKCVGQFNRPGNVMDVRFCLPAELYHGFMDVSSNPLKDFSNALTLRWHAKELVSIAAHRLAIFLRMHHPDFYRKVRHLNPDDRAEGVELFYSVFPRTVRNALGVEEQTLPYILRHTQLLPRHLLMYLNTIYRIGSRNGRSATPVITEDAVRAGVAAKEEELCGEVFSAYSLIYPAARKACERCIPELPFRFKQGKLHEVFNRHGKRAVGDDDYQDFKRMLIEIGALGRVFDETDLYVNGLFEYTVPHRLVTSTEDELCFHPVFLKVFSARKPARGETRRTVYPYGTDLDSEDARQLNLN